MLYSGMMSAVLSSSEQLEPSLLHREVIHQRCTVNSIVCTCMCVCGNFRIITIVHILSECETEKKVAV